MSTQSVPFVQPQSRNNVRSQFESLPSSALRALLLITNDPGALEVLKRPFQRDFKVDIADCRSLADAPEQIAAMRPDVVVLDLALLASTRRSLSSCVVELNLPKDSLLIVVADDETHAVEAYDAHVFDYLVRPLRTERLIDAYSRAAHWIATAVAAEAGERLTALLNRVPRVRYLDRVVIKNKGKVVFVSADDIQYLLAEGNYVRIVAKGQAFLLRGTISDYDRKLDPTTFVRVHRSSIVNMRDVHELRTGSDEGGYVLTMSNGEQIKVGRAFRPRLTELVENDHLTEAAR